MGCLRLDPNYQKHTLKVVYRIPILSQKVVQRFLSVDPLTKSYPELTPYQFASNTPIAAIDLDGLEAKVIVNKIGNIDKEIKIIESTELTPENNYHSRFGNFNDFANQNKYGANGTLVVNQFVDPVELPGGGKLNKYEYLKLSTWDNIKNAFTITPGDGGTQRGGISFTDGESGGSMETKDHALSDDVDIVDIGSLLIYLNYSKRDITTNFSTIRDIADPEVMADAADLIGDIGDLTKDDSGTPSNSVIELKKNDSTYCAFCKKNVLTVDTSEHDIRNEKK